MVIGFRVFFRLIDLGPAVEHLDFDRRQWLQSAHLQKEERMCADGAGQPLTNPLHSENQAK